MKEKIVNLLNNTIEAAVKNGADAGGSYNQNMEDLYKNIEQLLKVFELDDYKIVETGNINCYSPYKIEPKILCDKFQCIFEDKCYTAKVNSCENCKNFYYCEVCEYLEDCGD